MAKEKKRRTMPKQKPGKSRQTFWTPDDFIAATQIRLMVGRFAFDYAADSRNAKAEKFWTRHDDALSKTAQQWARAYRAHAALEEGGQAWAWLNPPFGDIGPWAKMCMEAAEEGACIAFLVPAAVGSNWFREYVDGKARVLALNGRLAFIKGQPKALYPKDCMLCLYGPDVAAGFEVWTWKPQRVRFDKRRRSAA